MVPTCTLCCSGREIINGTQLFRSRQRVNIFNTHCQKQSYHISQHYRTGSSLYMSWMDQSSGQVDMTWTVGLKKPFFSEKACKHSFESISLALISFVALQQHLPGFLNFLCHIVVLSFTQQPPQKPPSIQVRTFARGIYQHWPYNLQVLQ